MGSKSKHKDKKSHKKKEHKSKKKHKSKKDRRHSSSESDSSIDASSSRSNSPDRSTMKPKTANEIFAELAKSSGDSDVNWHLAQKSEKLLFDQHQDAGDDRAERFVWRKKHEKIGIDKLDTDRISTIDRLKKEETQRELEKLARRKVEREREREEREREREAEQRQKESEYHREWEKQEDSFQLKQVKLRSKIRIEEGRAKPIDLLAKYISTEEDDLALDMHEPQTYLIGLSMRDLEDLLADIKVYSDLERGANADYWDDISIITEEELRKLQRLDKNSRDYVGDRHEGISQSVLQDVSGLFKSKTYQELIKMEESIKKKIKEESGIDIGYWESLLSQLKLHMAQARLHERHKKVLFKRLQTLKQQQGIEDMDDEDYSRRVVQPSSSGVAKSSGKKYKNENEINIDDDDEEEDETPEEVDEAAMCINEYLRGCYSPVLEMEDSLDIDVFKLTQEEDQKRIELKRNQVLGMGSLRPSREDQFEAIAREKIAGDELDEEGNKNMSNTQEVILEQQNYLWSDRYRPRKPRYFNRVHTGYDWNAYNKKHYDVDNPPPKTIQGYKFNIFYPDLIDKTATPRYTITIPKDNKEFSILRFHAGPPYEDVAFKIVNREWDISHRHGFKNQFQNGVYQLWFHFRKWKYRR